MSYNSGLELPKVAFSEITYSLIPLGKKDGRVNYDVKFKQDLNPPQEYQRMPNYLCVWRKSLAVEFKDISYGEDAEWASRLIS